MMKRYESLLKAGIVLIAIVLIALFFLGKINAVPEGPDEIGIISNTTKSSVSSKILNISGGYVAKINLSATIKDTRWKGFTGQVFGLFTLDDANGATIYDWRLTSITGRVYATRNSTSVTWGNINCSNITFLNQENFNMNQANANDNLNITFNYSTNATHNSFYVGGEFIFANSCPTLNTYVNNATQDSSFEEMALYDGYNMVYATIMQQDTGGYDGDTYDFQMIVPENGAPGFSGATAYYLYVEIGT